MPAKSTNLIKGLENPSRNLANLTPVSTSLCTPISFQAFSSPLSPFSQSLLHVSLHCPIQVWLYSGLHPHSRDHSSFHSTLVHFLHHSPLHSAMHSPLHSPVYTPPSTAFPPHSPPFHRTFPSHLSLPLHSITQLRTAFSANIQEPGQALGWRVSVSRPDHRIACDKNTTVYKQGKLRAPVPVTVGMSYMR